MTDYEETDTLLLELMSVGINTFNSIYSTLIEADPKPNSIELERMISARLQALRIAGHASCQRQGRKQVWKAHV